MEPTITQASSVPNFESETVSSDDQLLRKTELEKLVSVMRPAVQADGGDVVLVSADLVKGIVELELQGACSSCAISETTTKAGIERILKQRLDWVKEVRGGTQKVQVPQKIRLGRESYQPKF